MLQSTNFQHVYLISGLAILRGTVTVLSHCAKRTMTLTQNDLLAVSFDVCLHLHNKTRADKHWYCAGI
jgi:hypothetical protein